MTKKDNLNDQVLTDYLARDLTILSPEVSKCYSATHHYDSFLPLYLYFFCPWSPQSLFSKIFSHNILSKAYSWSIPWHTGWQGIREQTSSVLASILFLPETTEKPETWLGTWTCWIHWQSIVYNPGLYERLSWSSLKGCAWPRCAVFRLLNYGLDASLRPLPRAPGRARALHARHTCSVQSPLLLLTSQSLWTVMLMQNILFLIDLSPPCKKRRGLAGSIVSTAVNAALIGTAVGLTVYRLWVFSIYRLLIEPGQRTDVVSATLKLARSWQRDSRCRSRRSQFWLWKWIFPSTSTSTTLSGTWMDTHIPSHCICIPTIS